MKPTASPPCFPHPGHRNMAEVMRCEPPANAFIEALTRTCPKCGAEPRNLCTQRGGRVYGGGIHNARRAG
jgi:hypothetical protein